MTSGLFLFAERRNARAFWSGSVLVSAGVLLQVANPLVPVALLIVGSSGLISILLPYAAENYPLRIRGRATGWVAGWSKMGGLIAQAFGVAGLAPALGIAAALVAVPAVLSLALIGVFGRETRGRDLRDLESSPARRVIPTEAARAD